MLTSNVRCRPLRSTKVKSLECTGVSGFFPVTNRCAFGSASKIAIGCGVNQLVLYPRRRMFVPVVITAVGSKVFFAIPMKIYTRVCKKSQTKIKEVLQDLLLLVHKGEVT